MPPDENLSEEQPLTGGFRTASVTRVGDTVRRTAGHWSPAVHAWLAYLASRGMDLAPRAVQLDLSTGVEVVSYIDGTVLSGGASPEYLWREETLIAVAGLVRRFHDASVGFDPPPEAAWQPTVAYPGGGDVLCHNDLAPWNTVFVEGKPMAFIDWDSAAPGPRLWDVAYALWHFMPLYGHPDNDPFDATVFEPRAQRARLFCDAYGLANRDRVVDAVIERQVTAREAIEHGAEAGEPSYQRLVKLGAVDGIIRQIGYVKRHSRELQLALS